MNKSKIDEFVMIILIFILISIAYSIDTFNENYELKSKYYDSICYESESILIKQKEELMILQNQFDSLLNIKTINKF